MKSFFLRFNMEHDIHRYAKMDKEQYLFVLNGLHPKQIKNIFEMIRSHNYSKESYEELDESYKTLFNITKEILATKGNILNKNQNRALRKLKQKQKQNR